MALNKAAPGSPDSSDDTPLPPYPRTTLHAPKQTLPNQPLRKLPSTAHAVDAEAFPAASWFEAVRSNNMV
ncbi:hypothetical protein J3F80_001842 [Coemansia sp. RSA 2526]|nr:hypothetical protein J3F80_001842 [Coemansia sp. RSA 2526]